MENFEKMDAIDHLRSRRNHLLKCTEMDGNGLADKPFTDEMLEYRQKLRDLPSVSNPSIDENGELIGVDFPKIPEF